MPSSSRAGAVPRRSPRRSPRSVRPAGGRPQRPVERPLPVPFAVVFGLLVVVEDGYLAWLLAVAWYPLAPALLAVLALVGSAMVWFGRRGGWVVLTVASVLPLLGLLAVAVVFGVVGGGSAFGTALLLLVGPVGALALATRPQVREWTARTSPFRVGRTAGRPRGGARSG